MGRTDWFIEAISNKLFSSSLLFFFKLDYQSFYNYLPKLEMSQQMTCIFHMFCFKITYVPRFILCLLYSFISSCCVELLLIGTSVD